MREAGFIIICGLLVLLMSGCAGRNSRPGEGLGFKRVTPEMAAQMERLMDLGCEHEFEYFDRDVALLYSVIPGGGQFYTGETRKGFMYLLSSPLIIPYIVAFQDAQSSVDYYNFKYTLHYCRKLLKMTKKAKINKNEIVIGGPGE